MGKIHLIRHGITEANQGRKYYGFTDVPLANEGIDKITEHAAAGIYPKADTASLYTSGLLRTEQTFFLIYGCREHNVISELREYHFGDFEMKSHAQLEEDSNYQAWMSDKEGLTPCPNGESPMDFRTRVKAGFSKILEAHNKKEDSDSIVVCHGGVISMIMGLCFPHDEKNVFQWQPDPGRGYTLHMIEGEAVSYVEI